VAARTARGNSRHHRGEGQWYNHRQGYKADQYAIGWYKDQPSIEDTAVWETGAVVRAHNPVDEHYQEEQEEITRGQREC
jgi:cation transport regulator ChaB